MISPFSCRRLPSLRVCATRGRLVCRISLPRWEAGPRGIIRELALVVSPTAPHLRHLTVYRRPASPPVTPGDPPQAA